MKKLYKLLLILFSFNLSTQAMESKRPRPNLPCKEPASKILIVEQEINFFEDTKKDKDLLNFLRTGHSPQKGKEILFSITSPLLKETNPKVQLQEQGPFAKKPVQRSLLEEFNRATHSLQKYFSPIHSSLNEFSQGQWVTIDPWLPNLAVAFDSDDVRWARIIDEMLPHLKGESPEEFLASITIWVHQNIDELGIMLMHGPGQELVCRHYATLSLVLLSKIFHHKDSPYEGKIHFMVGHSLNSNWEQVIAHAWNVVILDEGEKKSYWMVDIYNKFFIEIGDKSNHEDLLISKVYPQTGTHDSDPFQKDLMMLPWKMVKLSRERFQLGNASRRSKLYQDDLLRTIITQKILIRYKTPTSEPVSIELE